ncbi:MAG: phosphotransferase family protein [Pseudomonadota bacterium]
MHQFDHNQLAAYLAQHVRGFSTLDTITKFTDGQSNPTYKISSGKNTFVLRAKPLGKILKSAHAVDREYRVMQALADTDVPVPKLYHLSPDETPLGSQFMVMQWVDGQIFWDPGLPDAGNSLRRAVYDQMNKVLAALHNVAPASVGLEDFGKPGNYFARQLTRWSAQFKATETDALPDADWLIGWLAERMVEDDGAISIVHGDFRIDNMIFAHGSDTLLALLDWELSTLGHPFADLAYQCMQWRLPYKGDFRGLRGLDRASLGLPEEEAYVASYCDRRGITTPADWPFYVVFSYFRLLAILQGVLKRALDGNASNPRNQDMLRDLIALLARDARALAVQSA